MTKCRSDAPGAGEFGTDFIGYAADLSTIEKMLQRMFVGVPPGSLDRILDFSTAVTGSTYFVPSNDLLESLGVRSARSPPDRDIGHGCAAAVPDTVDVWHKLAFNH